MFYRFPKPAIAAHRTKGNKRGFALVLALALMSVTFLLVLSLISYVIVEIRMAETRKAQVLARVHAKLGLMVAIGELQKHVGPDQRVTATAAILDEDPYTLELEGVKQPYWTGVWKRNPAAPLAPLGQGSAEPWDGLPDSTWDPHPQVELAWLVSGNEGKKTHDDDYLHPVSSTLLDPEESSDASDVVLLVDHAVSQPEERVKALKTTVNFSFSDANVTASDTNDTASDETSGSYAYWVGDEGVKTKVNLPQPDRVPDAQGDFLLNQARFEVSPGPNLGLAERPDSSLDLTSMDSANLEKVVTVPQLRYASSDSDDSPDSLKDYFQHLTADGYGVLSDVLHGGLKRDLTAGLGDDDQFASYLAGMPIFKDQIPFMKDYDPLDWSKDGNRNLKWTDGYTNEMRWLKGPPWDYLRNYYMLFKDLKFDSSYPVESSLPPRAVHSNYYPNRNGEFWTEKYKRSDPRTHPITPLLLEAKVGHTLEMVPTGASDSKGKPLYRPRIAIFPSLALWNPYNVELEAQVYELLWGPDPKFWVYASNQRKKWANAVMRFEKKKKIPARRRLWDKDGNGRLTDDREYNTMHSLFLGSKKGRNIPYKQSPGQGGGGVGNISQGAGLRSIPRMMHRREFHLYRHSPRPMEYESVSGWVRTNGHWHPIAGNISTLKPLRLRTGAVSMAPGEKLYFTLAESSKFSPAEENVFNLANHLGFQHHLYYNVPRQLCPPIPSDEPVTFVYTAGGIGGYWLDPFQRTQELDEANKNPRVLGTTLFMIKNDGTRYPIKKINRGISNIGLKDQGSYQDYGRADIVTADPSRVIGPQVNHKLSTHHQNPQLIFVEHNPRSLVDPWHLGQGDQWWRGQESDFEGGIGDHDSTDEEGIVFRADPNPDESLSGDFYNGTGGRTYFGYQGHSFDVAGFQRVSSGNNGEQQFLPRSSRVVLFDVPRQPLMSLASLQHVNLSYFGNSPSYAIGNSYATSLVSRNRKWTRFNQLSSVPLNYGASKKRWGNEHQNTVIDYSYYANEKLWDGFFFSTVPSKYLETGKYPPFENFDQYYVDARKPLPNPRMVYYAGLDRLLPEAGGSLRHFQEAATNLLVDGAFNVNSTSVEAWKAQLGSLSQSKLHVRDLQDDNELAADGRKSKTLDFGSDQFPFPRLSVSMGEPVNPESDNLDQDFWTGFATLNEEQLQRLAEEVVQEVKFRGPFLSMGDFVNRRLANPPGNQIVRKLHKSEWPSEDEKSRQGLRGTLQAAIHDAGINDGGFREKYGYRNAGPDFMPDNVGQFNPFGYVAAGLNNDGTDLGNSQIPYSRITNWGLGYDRSVSQRRVPNQPGVTQLSYLPRKEFSHGEAPENMLAATNGVTGAMMPGWLSQADVLTSLAPVTNVRSDTFLVRTYGDVEPNYPGVKVWCEAIVQRLPEYVDDGDPPHARPMEPYDDMNGNGEHDYDEPFTDYDFDGARSFIQQFGDQSIQNPDNERFGRRFRIIRFRWLTADEV